MRIIGWLGLLVGLSQFQSQSAASDVTVQREGKQLIVRAHGREMFRYQAEPGELPRENIPLIYRRGGYLHPLYAPSGRLVTDDFPANHLHHHGIWAPWTKTEFEGRAPDFWNMGDGKGRVEFVAVDRIWNEPAEAGFTVRHRFLDLMPAVPKTVLDETWEVRAFVPAEAPGRFIFDWVSTQRCASSASLVLPEYHYGGLGVRGNWAWNGLTNGVFLTANGDTDRIKINGTRAKWFWMGGPVDGSTVGVAVLCHPANFRFPQPMRLHPSEPFFCYAPQQLGRFELKPGEPYVARYRFVTADGVLTASELDRLWDKYAAGP
ncbi:MAG TPA: PmoA family protein [Verrucomicrobiota bacterium]|nr:hypothetical protein [Verrucomicrobiales bacterium]HRI14619.1 PmoA family protein [Verrucomicrobiota bacterium]